MEAPKHSKMVLDLRQSPKWEKYMNFLGWEGKRIKNGGVLFFYKTPIGSLVKTQRLPFLSKKDLKEVDKVCKKHKALFIKIESSIAQDINVLEKSGYILSNFTLAPPSSLVIDLTKNEEALWKDLSRSGKYSVRRAQREDSKVKFEKNPSDKHLNNYFKKVQLLTGKRNKFHTQSLKDLTKKRDVFGLGSFLSLVFDKQDSLSGGKFYVSYKDTVTYLNGGTTEVGRKNKAGFAQMWESILYFKNLGFKKLDLEGVYDDRFPKYTKRWVGFSRFKEKFGGKIVRYPLPRIKYYSKVFRFAHNFGPGL